MFVWIMSEALNRLQEELEREGLLDTVQQSSPTSLFQTPAERALADSGLESRPTGAHLVFDTSFQDDFTLMLSARRPAALNEN